MNITLKLYATLADYLPKDAKDHATQLKVDSSVTPYEIIEQFNVPRESAHLILLNGVYVQPDARNEAIFSDGDTLAVWPPVAGGSVLVGFLDFLWCIFLP